MKLFADEKNIKEIGNFIIDDALKHLELLNAFQTYVDFESVQKKFNIILDDSSKQLISDNLSSREEIAGVDIDDWGFDIVFYYGYVPGYDDTQEYMSWGDRDDLEYEYDEEEPEEKDKIT